MTALLHHVSTKDNPVTDRQIAMASSAIASARAYACRARRIEEARDDRTGAFGRHFMDGDGFRVTHAEKPNDLHAHPDRSVHFVDDDREASVALLADGCATGYGAVDAQDAQRGVIELLDLFEAALAIVPSCRNGMDPVLQEAMDGLAWMTPGKDDRGPIAHLPWMWLAASPLRPVRMCGTDLPQDLHVPRIMCMLVTESDDRLFVRVMGFAGHTWWKRMNEIDGLRAVRTLEEWRARDREDPAARAA